MNSLPSQEDAPPTAETMALALRLASALGTMRGEGLFNVEQFCGAVERGMGGGVFIQAPSNRVKREVPEARYMPEGASVEVSYKLG